MPSHYNNPEMEVVNPGDTLKFSSKNLICARCGKKLEKKHYMIQAFVYLGSQSPRRDICKNCYDAFIDFMEECDDADDV